MQVREIDPPTAPAELLHALYRLEVAAGSEIIPLEPPRSEADATTYRRIPPVGEKRRYWIAELDNDVAAMAGMYVHGPKFVYVELFVEASHRRKGIGTALFAAVRAAAHEEGIASFFGHHATPAGAAFAAHAGAVDDHRDVRALLRLRDAELPAPVLPDGYSLDSWIGRCSDELVESFAAARAAMNDAPMPGDSAFDMASVEEIRKSEDTGIRRGREIRVTVALDPAGDVMSFAEIRLSPPPTQLANTDDTGTLARARGQGLARAVKLESLRRLRDERPDVELVTTLNAEENAAMRHINTTLGFVPTATLTTTVVTL